MSAHGVEGVTTEYVVGFAFDTFGKVALIEKNRPAWQAGRLNGIGGHVEPGEAPATAMRREFREETGTDLAGWELFAVMDFPGARIHFYRLLNLAPGVLDNLATTTDERVYVLWAHSLPGSLIPNLSWLIPLAAYTADRYEPIHVRAEMAEALTRLTPPGAGTAASKGAGS